MKFSTTHNLPKVARQLRTLGDDIIKKAVPRALNRTVEQARTAMSREIRAEFNMSASDVNQMLKVRKATSTTGPFYLNAELSSPSRRGRSLNLIRFAEKFVSLAQARKRMRAGEGGTQTLRGGGVVQKALELQFKIKKRGPKTMIKGAFIGNKGRTVFIREGDSRLPIKALQTIDVPQMFNTKRINARVRAHIDLVYPKNLAHEIQYFTRRLSQGGGR